MANERTQQATPIITLKSRKALRERGDDSVISRLHLSSDTEYAVQMAGDGTRPSFIFSVAHNEVHVCSLDSRGYPSDPQVDWRELMTPHEKVNVMNVMLDRYRQDSDDPKFKVASVGLTSTGNMYIAYNGSVVSTPSNRQCSEQKIASIAEEREKKKYGRRADELKFEEIYLQGAGPDIHVMGPCGNCTHLLAKYMDPEGKIYVLPANATDRTIEIDTEAVSVDDIGDGKAWETTSGHLNRHRVIELSEPEKKLLREGSARVKHEILNWIDAPDALDPNTAIFGDDWKPGSHLPIDKFYNKLNDFMEQQILITAANRLVARADKRGIDVTTLSEDQIGALVDDEITWVRCVVVQRDDGRLFATTTARTVDERSSTAAEQNAYRQGAAKHGTLGYRKMWCKEYNPADADRGVMRTSAKFAVESILKTASKLTKTVDFHYIPMTPGGLPSVEVAKIMHHREAEGLYPSAHVGEPDKEPNKDTLPGASYLGKIAPAARGTGRGAGLVGDADG